MPTSTIPYNVMPFHVRLPSVAGAAACAWAKPGTLKAPSRTNPPPANLTPRATEAVGFARVIACFTALLPELRLLDLILVLLHIYYILQEYFVSFTQQEVSGGARHAAPMGGRRPGRHPPLGRDSPGMHAVFRL